MPDGARRNRGRGRASKLTPGAIAEIRAWYELFTSLPSATEMAAKYGVCNETIYQVGRGLLHKRPKAQRDNRAALRDQVLSARELNAPS